MKKRIHYRDTTAQQRRYLFETWEATGNVTEACRQAHVGRGTFYYWKSRFDEHGYAGLEAFESKAPKNPRRTSPDVEAQVIAMRRDHPKWGRQRIADELAKANGWKPLVSANTVKRILKDAGLWETIEAEVKKKSRKRGSRTATEPGQTVNIDLCFVPATHEDVTRLPAVSGSSGKLKVQTPQTEADERTWPGQVFEKPELEYAEAMLEYVAASQERDEQRAKDPDDAETLVPDTPKAEKKALKREEAQLRDERRSVREQRKIEDEAWKENRAARKEEQEAFKSLPKEERQQEKAAKEAADENWRRRREKHSAKQEQRKEEDKEWREKRNSLRERMSRLPAVMAWVAILVIIDNCTRQCFGLPLFVVGPHVTSEMIVEALESLLPPELQFLISDRGIHFKAGVFKNFLLSKEVIHVLISRQRPETNGIAERFVRTLKDWLEDKTWSSDEELAALLEQFLKEYNDRPHQGLDMPGLSPNEYARRLKLKQPDG